MSSLLRLSIVYAGFVLPIRLANNTTRMIQLFVVFAVGYYALLRTGLINVVL